MNPSLVWWAVLSVTGVVQVAFALRLWLRRSRAFPLTLALVYAVVCCFRSLFPKVDVERLCFWDSPLSIITFGRSAATIAEVSFGLLLTLWFKDKLFVVFAVVANASCWIAVLTLNQLFHVVENSLWTLMGCWALIAHRNRSVIIYGCIPFVVYMVTVDLPMYYSRFLSFEGPYLTLAQGWKDASRCAIVSQSFDLWIPEIYWMTPYFTVFVWLAIYLASSLSVAKTSSRKQK